MSQHENKGDICVKLTRKNCRKVLGILEMFGYKLKHDIKVRLEHSENGMVFHYSKYFQEWLSVNSDILKEGKTLVKPRELRNILFREQLKKGDVVAWNYVGEDELWISEFRSMDSWKVRLGKSITPHDGYIDETPSTEFISDINFLRYATDEEKALLEPTKKLETITKEVWVNVYQSGDPVIHINEFKAISCRSKDGQTVKGTLTYQIEKK